MTTVVRWTGREAQALRQARRMSVRAFAAHLGVAAASVTNWERRGELIRLRHETQQLLDLDLGQSDDDVRDRFAATLTTARPAVISGTAHCDGKQRVEYVLSHPRRTDPITVSYLREQVARLDAKYDSAPSASLLGVAGQRHGQIAFLCASADSTTVRYELLGVLAESATLMGQLVWDASLRRDHTSALAYFDDAEQAAKECGDDTLTARAQLRKSLVALYGQKDPVTGLELAELAAATSHSTSNALAGLALLHVAEAHAMRGQQHSCEDALNAATNYLGKVGQADAGAPLLTPFDVSRMAGSCYLRLDDAAKATMFLSDTVRSSGQTKAAAVAAGNLALAYTKQHKIDEAVGSLHQAIDIIDATQGGGGLTIAFTAGRALNPWRHDCAVQDVHDRLLALMAA